MNRFGSLLFFLLAGAGLALPAQAQYYLPDDTRRPSAHIGITTGLGTTWLIDNKLLEDPNYQYVQTYRRAPIGITFGAHFNEHNGFQIEVNKVKQGADFQIINDADTEHRVGTKNIRLDYWSVPVMYKYTGGVDHKTRFEFHVGPQFSFLSAGEDVNRYDEDAALNVLGGKTELLANEMSPRKVHRVSAGTRETLGQKSDYRSMTLGAVFGIGLEFKIYGPLYLSTLVRGSYAFSDVRSDAAVKAAKDLNYYYKRQSAVIGAQIGLHYQFISPAEGHPKDHNF